MADRIHWIVWILLGVAAGLLLTGWPSPGHPVPSPWAVREVSPADDRTAATVERELARAEQRRAREIQQAREQAELAAELESIADLVPEEYRRLCAQVARAHGLDPRALAALGWVESRWNPDVIGAAGEVGIMQILPETGAWIAERLGVEEYDLRDPRTNVKFGAAYLRWLIQENHGSIDAAFAAYNGGPNAMERKPTAARTYVDRIRTAMATTQH